ncbi:MAG: autotransporter-associated beta strand repeat-containing protein [Verrucomicrobiota bacterium]
MKIISFLSILTIPALCVAQTTINYTDGENRTTTIDTSAPNDPTTLEISLGSATQSGIVSGDGGVIKTGTGILTFSAANTYTGTTTISEGQLKLDEGAESALSDSAVTIESDASLLLDEDSFNTFKIGSLAGSGSFDVGDNIAEVGSDNTDSSFSGTISHDSFGGLDKVGSGTLTLTGSGHSLLELTVKGSGELIFDGASGSFFEFSVNSSAQLTLQNTTSALRIRDLENSGSILVTGASTVAEIDDISNSGDLTVEDGATLTFTDRLSQTSGGTTTADRAQLIIEEFGGSSSTQTGTIAISDASGGTALTVGNSDDSTFQGTIEDHTSGAGSLLKTGSGTITLSGTNSFTGDTTIEDGTLKTDNLAGSLVQTGGVFSPGQSPATTTIGGDYTMDENSTLLIEIGGLTQGTDYDFLDVAGSVTLDGELEIELIDDFTPIEGDTFTIIAAAAGINGDFNTFTLPTLDGELRWNFSDTGSILTLEVIPEVSSYSLIIGVLALGWVLRNRRQ